MWPAFRDRDNVIQGRSLVALRSLLVSWGRNTASFTLPAIPLENDRKGYTLVGHAVTFGFLSPCFAKLGPNLFLKSFLRIRFMKTRAYFATGIPAPALLKRPSVRANLLFGLYAALA